MEQASGQKWSIPHISDKAEVIDLCSADPLFFPHYFFPRAYRQEDPPYARKLWAVLDNPLFRYTGVQIFRGGAKTTNLRVLAAKRIAFGISRTILYIGKSDEHARRSVKWLARAMQFNPRWGEVFGLYKGDKWAEGEIEFRHAVEGHSVFVTAAGITGSIRGINFEDYRPDLIICDDIIDRESVSTAAARKKITELVHGDIKESLEAETDNPNAKLVLLETPLSEDDPGEQAKRDPLWATFEFSCWTPETKDLDVDQQVSSWPARYPTEMLRREKKAAAQTNRLYIFIREKEIKLVSPETASFREEWIQTYDVHPPLEELDRVMWIDPVPPPSDKQIAEGLAKKDYEVLQLNALHKETGRIYCLESRANRGHEPDWTIKAFFEMVIRWRPRIVFVEGTAYQRTLSSLLTMAMRHRRMYVTISTEDNDRRSKHDKIVDGLHGPLSNRMVFIRPEMTTLRAQIVGHPDIEHDDEVECLARSCEKFNFGGAFDSYADLMKEEDEAPALGDWRMDIDRRIEA